MAFSTKSFTSRDTNNSSRAYARAADHASYKYYNNITWSMWCCLLPGVNKHIWSMWEDSASANRCWLFSTQENGTLRIIFSWDGTNFSLHTTQNVVFRNDWVHIMITFASGTFNVYVDNVLQTLTQTLAWGGGSAALHSAGQRPQIGATNATPAIDQSPGGSKNNFSMWSKVLSADERTELYNDGVPFDLTTHSAAANLTNWIRMDQSDTAPTLIDAQAGSGANYTITTSGTSGLFTQCNNYKTRNVDPGVASVLAGQTYVYDGEDRTGTLDIGASVWDATTSSYTDSGSFGALIQKLLTVSKFLGLK